MSCAEGKDARKAPLSDFIEIPADMLDTSIVDVFEDVVSRHGDRIAVGDMDLKLTYNELNDAANRIAHRILDARGEKSEGVAFLLEKNGQELAQRLLVIHHQNAAGAHCASPLSTGSSTVTTVPRPGALSMAMVPACSETAA